MGVVLRDDLFAGQIILPWQKSEIVNSLKTSYYGNLFIRNRRDSFNRCSIDFMLSGCKT